jgi:hypothetical protein
MVYRSIALFALTTGQKKKPRQWRYNRKRHGHGHAPASSSILLRSTLVRPSSTAVAALEAKAIKPLDAATRQAEERRILGRWVFGRR